jgi:hypothetical protein
MSGYPALAEAVKHVCAAFPTLQREACPMLPAAKHRRRVPPEEFLTPTDRLLMERQFDTPDPERLPGLVDRLPEDAAIDGILFRYDVTPDGGMRNREGRPRIHCAHCNGARHWRGFVIELKDGAMALLGEDCGEKQFGIDFRRVESDFHGARGQQFDLRRVMELRALLPAAEAELEALRRCGAMAAFDTYMSGLRKFGKLAGVLQRIAEKDGGMLTCTSFQRDVEAEARRAEKIPEARHYREKIAGAQTEYMRREREKEYRRYLDGLPPIGHDVVETIGRLAGGGIFVMAPGGMVTGMRAARDLLTGEIEAFLCSHSDEWHNKRRLRKGIDTLRQGMGLVYRAFGLLAELERFTAPENLAAIAAWSQREVEVPQPRIVAPVIANGRVLTDEDGEYALTLPPASAVPATPHLDALRAVLGE